VSARKLISESCIFAHANAHTKTPCAARSVRQKIVRPMLRKGRINVVPAFVNQTSDVINTTASDNAYNEFILLICHGVLITNM